MNNWVQNGNYDDEEEDSVYSSFGKRRRKNEKHSIFTLPLQHNHLLDIDDNDQNDEELFPNVGNGTFDSDSIFTRSEYSTNLSIESSDINQAGHGIENNNIYSPPLKKPINIKIRKRTCPNKDDNQQLIPVHVLPEKYREFFKFSTFNKMQSIAFNPIYYSKENCIISSPTGSGKTVLFELAIISVLISQSELAISNLKILYVAPTKSLCSEILKKWELTFSDLSVGMFTGDTTYKESDSIRKSNIIITTPEKWDLLTRKWQDYNRLFDLVQLILVDEVHTIGDSRGATLEVVLTRMNILCPNIRFIAASATIPNIIDIAEWLKNSDGKPAKYLVFDDGFRQVDLEKYVLSFPFLNKNEFQKDALYNTKLIDIILQHYKRKPVLIFCPTRASTVSTSKYLCKHFPIHEISNTTCKSLRLTDRSLEECVRQGIAFHNAGLSYEDRNIIQQNFINGQIKILCCTSTLAVGVNLPAYLVLIKGTSIWSVHGNKDYSKLEILQMIGRAGRPQFEKEGCAIILTDSSKKTHFEDLLNGNDMLESTLHLNLYEHLCSEISLGTITSSHDAIKWLRNTFLYIRYHKNPKFYFQIRKNINQQDDADSQLTSFCRSLIKELTAEDLVVERNERLECSIYGKAMVRHYILFETMKKFIKTPQNLSLDKVIDLLAKSTEFNELRIRQNEKRFYKEINSSPLIRFPYLTDSKQSKIIDQTYQKISLLVQYELGGLEFPLFEWSFKIRASVIQDRLITLKHSQRLLKCMVDTFINKNDGESLKNSLFLLRSVNGNSWEDSTGIIRQLKLIGLVAHRKLVNQGITSFRDISNSSEEQLEYYLGLKIGLGNKIKEDLSLLPQLKIRMKVDKYEIMQPQKLEINFKVEISAEFKSAVWHGKYLSIDVESLDDMGRLLDFRRIQLKQLKFPKSFRVKARVTSENFKVTFLMNCQEIAGIGQNVEFAYNDIEQEYRKTILKKKITSSTLEKCLFIEEYSSDPLLSDDSILNYLEEEEDKIQQKKENAPKTQHTSIKNSSHVLGHNIRNTQNFQVEEQASTNVETYTTLNNRKLLVNGNYECNHFCKDKTKCRHFCCRDGIPRISSKNTNKIKPHSVKEVTPVKFNVNDLHTFKYSVGKENRILNKPLSHCSSVKEDDYRIQDDRNAKIYEIELNTENDDSENIHSQLSDNTTSFHQEKQPFLEKTRGLDQAESVTCSNLKANSDSNNYVNLEESDEDDEISSSVINSKGSLVFDFLGSDIEIN